MSLFKPDFFNATKGQLGRGGMFKPHEVEWDKKTQSYHMAGPACVCFMLFEAFAPDSSLTAERHAYNRAMVLAGVRLAVQAGFSKETRLIATLTRAKPDAAELRALSDEMLQHVTAEQFLECVFSMGPTA